ncbi:NTP transferase domain-containing protein [bacterium]|nr:NTP transferase domain-containing protein [bacterium]
MLHTVIMAGGSGTRFWPASRRAFPKQFLKIGTEQTLIQETFARCLPLSGTDRTWVVTGLSLELETERQLPELPPKQILIEPCARNTAPCVGLAAIQLLAVDPEATMLIVPADHVIQPASAFHAAVEAAVKHTDAHPDQLVLFGVKPNYPATGFGYIQRVADSGLKETDIIPVQAFKEKPDRQTAEQYCQSSEYLWNCGIFVWKARTILAAIEQFEPDMYARLMRLQKAIGTEKWKDVLDTEFPEMASISIDYAVLERSSQVSVLQAPFGWDDVGSWQAMARLSEPNAAGNTIDALHVGVETQGCIIRGSSNVLIATVGVQDLIIVQTATATLIADRHDESAVKRLLAQISGQDLESFL